LARARPRKGALLAAREDLSRAAIGRALSAKLRPLLAAYRFLGGRILPYIVGSMSSFRRYTVE
jgi:hypothetical protein